MYKAGDRGSTYSFYYKMTVKALVTIMVGSIAFVIIDKVVTAIITGTDTGSVLIQSLLRLVVAAGILITVVRNLGGKG